MAAVGSWEGRQGAEGEGQLSHSYPLKILSPSSMGKTMSTISS